MVSSLIRYMVIITGLLFASFSAASDNPLQDVQIPETVNPALDYLLSQAVAGHSPAIDSAAIAPVFEFVLSSKDKNNLYYPGNRSNISSAYHEFEIHKGIKHILDLGFNPDIPPFILSPSCIRLTYWTEVNGTNQAIPLFSSLLSHLDQPVIVNGAEHEEITPDLNTGAYYGYDMDRTIILMTYQGRPALISISKQKNISDVGKKGVVLGKDDNWDYFYSGQSGLTKPGLGWVNSYMYDSYGISVFFELNAGQPLVRCGIFKWLRAGWADMNMVQNKHIYRGLERYASTVKQVLESPFLPEPQKMAETFSAIKALSTNELRDKIKNYITQLSLKYGNESSTEGKLIAETMKSGNYIDQLNPYQMQSILSVEYMKYLLGKKTIQDMVYFIPPNETDLQRKS